MSNRNQVPLHPNDDSERRSPLRRLRRRGTSDTATTASDAPATTPVTASAPSNDVAIDNVTRSNRGCFSMIALLATILIVGTGVLLVLGACTLGLAYANYSRMLPATQSLDISAFNQSSKIYDRNGALLFEVFDPQGGKRTLIKPEQIPQVVRQATIATEDPSFYTNWGVDPLAIVRAVYYDLRYGRAAVGGSTITQQLVKNLFLSTEPTLERKIREALLAVEITRRYKKDDILAAYLNAIYYGNLAYGIEAGSQQYFGKSVAQLDLAEASLLVGLPQAPAVYDPCQDDDAALARQQIVLDLMMKQNFIMQSQADAAQDEMKKYLLSPDFAKRCKASPVAVQQQAEIKAPHFVNYVRAQLEQKYGPEVMYKGGLQITTTIDMNLQAIAEDEARKQIATLKDKNVSNAAVVIVNPHTGEMLAMVGSVDFFNKDIAGQVNVANRLRQPGSSIKPINYVTAFKYGWAPSITLYDLKTDFPAGGNNKYTPVNYDGKEHGLVPLRVALGSSLNIPAVKTLYFTSDKSDKYSGPKPLAMMETARNMGITSFGAAQQAQAGTAVADAASDQPQFGLALTLGGGDVKLIELAGAYAVFANNGAVVPPTPYLKIRDGRGNSLYDLTGTDKPATNARCALFDPNTQSERPDANGNCIKSAPYAYLINSILSDDGNREIGFGRGSLLNISHHAAVKTGTTNDFRDNWTLGYTPDMVVGVWVGNANNSAMKGVTGITGAAPIWHNVMERVVAPMPNKEFQVPAGIAVVEVCTNSGLPTTDLCPANQRYKSPFVADRIPNKDTVWQRVSDCGFNGVFAEPLHDVDDVIPYDRILAWARSSGWPLSPKIGGNCSVQPAPQAPAQQPVPPAQPNPHGQPPGKKKKD